MAALPPPDAALLFRAAVRAVLPDADDLAIAECARTLERLAPVLDARTAGAALILLTYTPGKAQPKITPWQGAADGLWLD